MLIIIWVQFKLYKIIWDIQIFTWKITEMSEKSSNGNQIDWNCQKIYEIAGFSESMLVSGMQHVQ